MSDDTPIHELSPQQATERLAQLQAAYDARNSPPPAPDKPSDPAGARAKLDALGKDPNFYQKLEAGSADEVRVFKELTAQAAGVDAEVRLERVLAGEVHNNATIETVSDNQLSTSKMASAVGDLRARGFADKAIREIFSGEKGTAEQVAEASYRKSCALQSPEWVKSFLAGDFAALRDMTCWNAIIAAGVRGDAE
jgi:hypothetical protein